MTAGLRRPGGERIRKLRFLSGSNFANMIKRAFQKDHAACNMENRFWEARGKQGDGFRYHRSSLCGSWWDLDQTVAAKMERSGWA